MRLGASVAMTLALVAACSRAATAPRDAPVQTGTILPLTVGTSWTYDALDTVLVGQPPTGGGAPPPESFKVYAETTDASGTRWALINGGGRILGGHFDEVLREPHLWKNFADGAYTLEAGRFLLSYYPYPTPRGYVYRYGAAVVSSIDTVITVPAGRFHCLRYDGISGGPVFVSPGVGVVERRGEITTLTDAGQVVLRVQRVYRLRSFAVAP